MVEVRVIDTYVDASSETRDVNTKIYFEIVVLYFTLHLEFSGSPSTPDSEALMHQYTASSSPIAIDMSSSTSESALIPPPMLLRQPNSSRTRLM
jgi:hypothetical protein